MPTAPRLNRTLRVFIAREHMFFVATAARDGRVNVSPKEMDTLRVLNDRRVQWLNLSGSGNETAAHIADTARMTLLFCAFDGDPLILRVCGEAAVCHPRDREWKGLAGRFPELAGGRQMFDLSVELVQTSRGTGVPVMNFEPSRGESELVPFYDAMGEAVVRDYPERKNPVSIDGKPTGILADGT